MIKAAVMAGANNAQLNRLVQLLHDHPDVELIGYADAGNIGQTLDNLYPALTGETDLTVSETINPADADVVFLAGEPNAAVKFMDNPALPENLIVIDMTGAFRNTDDARFVQGIPELNRKAMVRGARFVAMPDATTTAVSLALLPLAKNLMLKNPVTTVVVANSTEAEPESLTNKLIEQNTLSEIEKALTSLQPALPVTVKGVAFHGDIPEGIMAVTTVDTDLSLDELTKIYEEFYDDHNFTFIVDNVPDISDVRDTNKSFIHLAKTGNKALITTALDTDMKGGAGNAVHAMNLLFGLIEKVGL